MTTRRQRNDGAPPFDESVPRRRSTEYSYAVDSIVVDFGSPSKQDRAKKKLRFGPRSFSTVNLSSQNKSFDAQQYLDKRVMTKIQERFNALTMLPTAIYSFHFILAGCWVTATNDDEHFDEEDAWADTACINSVLFPHLPALPPLPVAAAAIGVVSHAPFSMLYHWKYATTIEPSKRIGHWSRRIDHAFIHFASACAAYATSGSLIYFFLNALYNLDCAFRQFEEEVKPRRNLSRIGTSIFLYLLPVLVYGHYGLFAQFLVMFTVGGVLFVKYPVGGWSHGLFHLILTFLPYLVMTAALELESSQVQVRIAAKCMTMAVPPYS